MIKLNSPSRSDGAALLAAACAGRSKCLSVNLGIATILKSIVHVYIHVYIYIYIYVYIERENKKERAIYLYIHIYIYVIII